MIRSGSRRWNISRAGNSSATEGVHRDIYLLVSKDHGDSFAGFKLHPWEINACPMSSMAFAGNPTKVEGAWETGGQIYFANISGTNSVPVNAPGQGRGCKHPRIALAPDGKTLMVWTEGTIWGRGGSLAWQLYDPSGKVIGATGTTSGLPAWSFGAVAPIPNGFVVLS